MDGKEGLIQIGDGRLAFEVQRERRWNLRQSSRIHQIHRLLGRVLISRHHPTANCSAAIRKPDLEQIGINREFFLLGRLNLAGDFGRG